jgi:hypothetical protein
MFVLMVGTSASKSLCCLLFVHLFARDAVEVAAMSGTFDCDNADGDVNGQAPSFFGTGHSTIGYGYCSPSQTNDVYGCGNSNAQSILNLYNGGNFVCGALTKLIGTWAITSSSKWYVYPGYDVGEAVGIYKTGIDQGGALCCKNVTCNCPSGQYCPSVMSGCADGTREYFTDRSSFPDIAGCSGGWSVPGVSQSTNCSNNAGNNSPNPTGTGCSAAGKKVPFSNSF